MEKPDLSDFPLSPGVYLYKDANGKIIYVGKARRLRLRIASYFRNDSSITLKTKAMLGVARSISVLLTETEKEALLLEASLIKKHRPRYNISLRDDKERLLFKIEIEKDYPRVEIIRHNVKKRSKTKDLLFGPFTSSLAARTTWDLIHKYFPLRTCKDVKFNNRTRPCLYYDMKRCLAPCVFPVSRSKYHEIIQKVELILSGRSRELLKQLQEEMAKASDALEFEKAADLRDQIKALEQTIEKQSVVLAAGTNLDFIAVAQSSEGASLGILFVRDGLLIDGSTHFWPGLTVEDTPELLYSFLTQFYLQNSSSLPTRIIVPWLPNNCKQLNSSSNKSLKAAETLFNEIEEYSDNNFAIGTTKGTDQNSIISKSLEQKQNSKQYNATSLPNNEYISNKIAAKSSLHSSHEVSINTEIPYCANSYTKENNQSNNNNVENEKNVNNYCANNIIINTDTNSGIYTTKQDTLKHYCANTKKEGGSQKPNGANNNTLNAKSGPYCANDIAEANPEIHYCANNPIENNNNTHSSIDAHAKEENHYCANELFEKSSNTSSPIQDELIEPTEASKLTPQNTDINYSKSISSTSLTSEIIELKNPDDDWEENFQDLLDTLALYHGKSFALGRPKNATEENLLIIATNNANQALKKTKSLISELLAKRFNSGNPIKRIESVDISHTSGKQTRAGLVVFMNEKPEPESFRTYSLDQDLKDSSALKGDDYAALSAWAKRRINAGPPWPDLLLIDGGRGQLSAVEKSFIGTEAEGKFIIASIAKARKENGLADRRAGNTSDRIFVPNRRNPLNFPSGCSELLFLQRIRDSVHDYVIGKHRKARSKATLMGELSRLPGIGEHFSKLLFNHFGSLDKMSKATEEELSSIPGIGKKRAAMLKKRLETLINKT